MVSWKGSIDSAAADFRYWYSIIQVPTDVGTITIQVVESFYYKITSTLLHSTIGDLLGTDNIMEMTVSSMFFIIIFR